MNVKTIIYVYDLDIRESLDYRETGGLALLAQLVEHSIRNAGAASSSLARGTIFPRVSRGGGNLVKDRMCNSCVIV